MTEGPDLPEVHEGLSSVEAQARLARDGANALPVSARKGLLRLLRDIASEPMFLLLVACGAIYLLLGDVHEALMLLGFVFVVMAITFVQQRRTERSLDALRELSIPQALVLRDGSPVRLAQRELVRGDIVLLAEGDRVSADMVLVQASNLSIDESMLTGESMPIDKRAASVEERSLEDGLRPDQDPVIRAYAGTLVTRGTAQGRVIATGANSALGLIGQSLSALGPQSTPIQRETGAIVKRVAVVGLALAAALAVAHGWSSGDWLKGLLAGLTLAMAVLPEELPVVLTLFLGLGAWRLAREGVLARSIPAVELLGATTVLCVDKTGTLTANQMTLRRIWSPQADYDCLADAPGPLPETLHEVLEFSVLASHRQAFDPMESAITDSGRRLLADTEHLHGDWSLIEDYPLSADMLAMSRVWQSPDRCDRLIAAKGAPESIVDLCHLSQAERDGLVRQVALLAADGLRVLGVARAQFEAAQLPPDQHDFAFDFLGLIAFEDPLRSDVPAAIASCKAAGIRVVMITGDHPATAQSIARQAGLSTDGEVITGTELSTLSHDALDRRLAFTDVFCRVLPEQKLRLVQAFRAHGEVVAMTGDGVNDAPALKAADIGVAMGARGTDVAREAAALVLLNDDFGSLVTAVQYGRRVFDNLRKAIAFLVAAHVPIVGLSILPLMFGWPMLLMPVHILFLQLIIDPACSVVFEAEPLEVDAMTRPPRRADARLFDMSVLVRGLWQGSGLLLILLGVFAFSRQWSGSDAMARATVFSAMVLSNLALIFANRHWNRLALPGRGPSNAAFGWIAGATAGWLAVVLGVPQVSRLFSFEQPSPALLMLAVAAAAVSLLWFEAVKWRIRGGG
jgi:Ca2+-transporting ATPase